MFAFIKEVFQHFFKSNTFQKGASLGYYAVFSFLPIIIIVTSILGLLFGKQAISGEIYTQLKGLLGSDAAIQIQDLIKNQHYNHNSILTTLIGLVTLFFSASKMFIQIHNSFNNVWDIKSKPKNNVVKYISKHFASFLLLIFLFFLLGLSTAVNSFLLSYSKNLHYDIESLFLYEYLASIVVLSLIFAIMFKFLGDAIVHWKIAFSAGLFTAVFFTFGKIIIGLYIKHSHITSAFGSASVLALLMLWVYYTSQILFLGASFAEILGRKTGLEIKPKKNAVKIKGVELNDN